METTYFLYDKHIFDDIKNRVQTDGHTGDIKNRVQTDGHTGDILRHKVRLRT